MVVVSAWQVGGTRVSGIVSSAADVVVTHIMQLDNYIVFLIF